MPFAVRWIHLRLFLTRLRVDLCYLIAPGYASRSLRRRFDELPESLRRVLLEKHGLKSL
jgi:hypothetical protein